LTTPQQVQTQEAGEERENTRDRERKRDPNTKTVLRLPDAAHASAYRQIDTYRVGVLVMRTIAPLQGSIGRHHTCAQRESERRRHLAHNANSIHQHCDAYLA